MGVGASDDGDTWKARRIIGKRFGRPAVSFVESPRASGYSRDHPGRFRAHRAAAGTARRRALPADNPKLEMLFPRHPKHVREQLQTVWRVG